jgi:hypothetical protein
MKTFVEFIDTERSSTLPALPNLPKLPGLPKLPKLPKMNGGVDNRVNSGPPQKMAPAQAIPQLQQMIVQLSMLIRRLSQG